MTATIVDFAARRAERDATPREDFEVATYGIVQCGPGEGLDFFAELRSGRRVLIASSLSLEEATKRLFAALEDLEERRRPRREVGQDRQALA